MGGQGLGWLYLVRRLRVVILDACRNNPLGERMTLRVGLMRSVTRGLARIEPKGDVLVAYAARAGTLALDGAGRHSPFAEALLKHMITPGLDVRLMFGKVRDQVLAATRRQQEPYIYGSLSGDVIPLVPAIAVSVADTGAAEAWSVAKDTTNIPALEAFVRRFGDTYYGDFAKVRLAELKQADAAKQATEAAKKKADDDARAKAEAERQRLASFVQQEDRKRVEAAAKKKADDDARAEAVATKKQAEEEARAKRAAEEVAERRRLAALQHAQEQKREPDKLASAEGEKALKGNAAQCEAKARRFWKRVSGWGVLAIGATGCAFNYGQPNKLWAERRALSNCSRKTTGCRIIASLEILRRGSPIAGWHPVRGVAMIWQTSPSSLLGRHINA